MGWRIMVGVLACHASFRKDKEGSNPFMTAKKVGYHRR